MYNHLLYLAYWIVNAAVLFFTSLLIPAVRLGGGRFNSIESAFYAGFWLTFLIWVFWDFAIARKFNFESKTVNFSYFLLVNFISIWVISRFSSLTGFALTNYAWALVIALAAVLLQKIGWRLVVKRGLF